MTGKKAELIKIPIIFNVTMQPIFESVYEQLLTTSPGYSNRQ